MNYHYLVLAALLLAPPALAQTPPADPEKQALSQAILDLTSQNITLRTQLIEANQKSAEMQKAIEATKAANPPNSDKP